MLCLLGAEAEVGGITIDKHEEERKIYVDEHIPCGIGFFN